MTAEPVAGRLVSRHSHLFPGATGRAEGAETGAVELAFADGVTVIARLSGGVLTVPGHRTAAGRGIAEKRWRVLIADGRFRVLGRA
jgi:hypothetical protein